MGRHLTKCSRPRRGPQQETVRYLVAAGMLRSVVKSDRRGRQRHVVAIPNVDRIARTCCLLTARAQATEIETRLQKMKRAIVARILDAPGPSFDGSSESLKDNQPCHQSADMVNCVFSLTSVGRTTGVEISSIVEFVRIPPIVS
jgi:hypothetical protein